MTMINKAIALACSNGGWVAVLACSVMVNALGDRQNTCVSGELNLFII